MKIPSNVKGESEEEIAWSNSEGESPSTTERPYDLHVPGTPAVDLLPFDVPTDPYANPELPMNEVLTPEALARKDLYV